MNNEEIIRTWNMGLTVIQVSKEYMRLHNEEASRRRDIEKITLQQALEYVEPILYKYRMKQLKN